MFNEFIQAIKKTSLKKAFKKAADKNSGSNGMADFINKKIDDEKKKEQENNKSNDVKTFDLKSCIGKSESDVADLVKDNNMECFIARRDQEYFWKDQSVREDRINVEIEAGVVVAVTIG